jgi:hypothetical protein
MNEIKIIPTTHLGLYCHYSGQINPQGCYIEFDPRINTALASYNAEIGNAIPIDLWKGLYFRFALPYSIYGKSVDQLMEQLIPLFTELSENYEEFWDGNNFVGKLTDRGDKITELIQKEIENSITEEYDAIKVWDADNWFECCNAADFDININTTDEELEQLAEKWSSDEQADIIEGVQEFFEKLRDNLFTED